MTKLRRSTTILCLFLGTLGLAAPSWAETRPPIAKQIAKAQGLDSFEKIEAIRYTFNVEIPGVSFSRSWVWYPKTGQVSYQGKDKDGNPVKATYYQSQLDSAPANVKNQIDPQFLNDQYNLLFPLHVYWDSSADVQDMGKQKLPLGTGMAKQVVVKYPSEGGYTPGDTWELYVGSDHRIKEFIYRRGAPTPPPSVVISAWAGYKKAGPLVIATDRRGTADGKPAHVFFTDVAVKLVGSDKWVSAK
jgi:hypothetical protein